MGKKPLEGIRVFFMGSTWAGPMCATMLSDMGAQVIHQESHSHIEIYRYLYTPDRSNPEGGPMFHVLNRGHLSVCLDLPKPEAVELAKRIIKISDIFFGNNAGGILGKEKGKLGLSYDIVKETNPHIIMVDMTGFGDYGPLKSAPAYGTALAAHCGFSNLTGYCGETPLGENQFYSDPVSGTHALVATMAALHYRNKTGKGQYIDIAEGETLAALLGREFLDYTMNGRIATCQGNRSYWMAPHGCYPCQGDNRWITIACATEEEWQALCVATGNIQWLDDERFADMYSRLKNSTELDKLIGEWTSWHTDYEAMEMLQKASVAAVPIFSIADLFTDPHAQAEEYYIPLPHPYDPASWVYTPAWKLSETPGEVTTPAPLLGEHSEHVLCELCGLPKNEFDRLVKEKIIW